jgi:hypothetical protein
MHKPAFAFPGGHPYTVPRHVLVCKAKDSLYGQNIIIGKDWCIIHVVRNNRTGDRLRVADPNYSLLTVGLPKKEMARRLADDSKDHSKGM